MDLRTHYPRSVKEKLGGYVHLGRMLDKCRAMLAGTLGEYIYPCPMDQRLLDFVGITAEQFTEAVRTRETDDELLGWFKATAKRHSETEIQSWNETMLALSPDAPEKWDYFKKTRDAIDPSRTDITSWADLLDLDEKRPVPKRTVSVGGR